MGIQQYFLNRHFAKVDINEIVKKNIEKANKKRAKKGLPPIDEKADELNRKRIEEKAALAESRKEEKIEKSKAIMEKSNEYYELDSIASRAKMVEQYNNKKAKKK